MRKDYGERARALVGTRFRPQGRGERGVDCIGLVLATLGLEASTTRLNYRLRGDHRDEIERGLSQHLRKVPASQLRAGDVMLLYAARDQLHLAIRTTAGFVHAHAGIGRVVETPGMPEWPLLGVYRKRARAARR